MDAILITQCLQNDFVKPLEHGEALPNKLHIGHDESIRLVGENITNGPLGRFIEWVKTQPNDSLGTIHIRDWHDPESTDQQSHLTQFGHHCLQGTHGAEFVFSSAYNPADDTIINSTTLNDFEGTRLTSTLEGLVNQTGEKPLMVGIVGVWTEAKILFLAYELSTRFPNLEIAVCSALTASSSRSQHFLALQQLDRIVGVTVIDSIGEFVQFLGGEYTPTKHLPLNKSLKIKCNGELNLDDENDQLIRYLFRDCQNISLKVLDGGFSGNLVAGVESIDMLGHEQAPHVIKIGPRNLMAKERTAFEQIERILGNNAPAIAEYVDSDHKGAIKYRYASMGSDKARSLQQCFQQGESLEKIYRYLNAVFEQQLGRFYRAAVTEKQDLLAYYCFDSQWANSVKAKIEELIGQCPESEELQLPGGRGAYNLYRFYHQDLDKLPSMNRDFAFSFVHGDLNGANIIVDEQDNVWLIDFFHTHRGHILKDFVKLENDLLYIYTPIDSDEELVQAYEYTDYLLGFEHPLELSQPLPGSLIGSQFERTHHALTHIREKVKNQLSDHKISVDEWLLAQMRYSVHTIGFDEPNTRQRIWALYTSARIAQLLSRGAT